MDGRRVTRRSGMSNYSGRVWNTGAMGVDIFPSSVTRRQLLRRAALAGGLGLWGNGWERAWAQAGCEEPAGELVRTLPLYGPGAVDTPLGQMLGGPGLDARFFTDLTRLDPRRMVTPTGEVFVRTAAPSGLRHNPAGWPITVTRASGLADRPLMASQLLATSRAMGVHLIECAGNSNPQNFGLMSAVEWDGVPLVRVLEMAIRPPNATAVLVTGEDHDGQASARSRPGASWVIPIGLLTPTGPFLATRMNGLPLTPDHGAPVRLVVPGWYGCAWIKWVKDVRFVTADELATSQMVEFAGRTHQDGLPVLARDYGAPAIDTAAMPVRVEQRRVNGVTEYRVVGIAWGGAAPVDRLLIRFGGRDAGTPVRVWPAPTTHHTWSLWTHRWRPTEPGYYDISLRTADAAVRTRRLDLSFYIRRVRIDEPSG